MYKVNIGNSVINHLSYWDSRRFTGKERSQSPWCLQQIQTGKRYRFCCSSRCMSHLTYILLPLFLRHRHLTMPPKLQGLRPSVLTSFRHKQRRCQVEVRVCGSDLRLCNSGVSFVFLAVELSQPSYKSYIATLCGSDLYHKSHSGHHSGRVYTGYIVTKVCPAGTYRRSVRHTYQRHLWHGACCFSGYWYRCHTICLHTAVNYV